MENAAAVCTGAEQQYMISWSQQRRIWCLFKIRGGRGRKWLAPVVIFERRGSSGLRKMGSRWLVSVHPVRVQAKDQPPRDTGPGLTLTRGIFGWSQKIRIWALQDTLAKGNQCQKRFICSRLMPVFLSTILECYSHSSCSCCHTHSLSNSEVWAIVWNLELHW